MCLIVFAWKAHPDYKLVLAANRDEFHRRPAKALGWWPDMPGILAGRDLQAGGTWLAAHRKGRFATVTNYRERSRTDDRKKSRGSLVTEFVSGNTEPMAYTKSVAGEQFAGFSMLAATNDELVYLSNRNDEDKLLSPGVYGLSNATLDTPWPKVVRSRDALNSLLDAGQVNESTLMHLLANRTLAQVADVDSEQLPFELARALTAPFIVSPDYGTRCSTVVLWSNTGDVVVSERRFDPAGEASGESRFGFAIGQP
jgi:uncharacterized protein with NRDE domain